MGQLKNIVTQQHQKTKREYLPRMIDNKLEAMKVAKKYDHNYWDGDRRYGYGGYKYDGRWITVAEALIKLYNLKPDAKILDIGCGRAHLLCELKKLLPDAHIVGFDSSQAAIDGAPELIKEYLYIYKAQYPYPYGDSYFDFVLSLGTLHNLKLFELQSALKEIERIGKQKFIMVESYRNDTELFNLQCWALTCESFFEVSEWIWLLKHFGYTGDYEFIYFE